MPARAKWISFASSAVVSAVPGVFIAVNLTAGADTATAIVYDNASTTGTVVCKLSQAANTTGTFQPIASLPMANGIYVAITGTTPTCTVVYMRGA
jgi:hypothetical protein